MKKAAKKRENALIKAEDRVNKITDKFDSKKRKIEDKKNVKVAKNEVKKLKAQGASKDEINAAKQALKDAKKTRKEHKKEDGRGFFRRTGNVIKKGAMLPVRGAFLALLNINFRGLAKRLHDNKEAFGKFDKKWRKVFGGKTSKLKIAVNKGSYKKALFGQSKKGKVNGLGAYLGQFAGEPVEMTAGAWAALASSALTAVVAILKACGVNVPESLDEAIEAGEDAAAILDGEMIAEDPDNYEDGSDNDEPIEGDGETDIESIIDSIAPTYETAQYSSSSSNADIDVFSVEAPEDEEDDLPNFATFSKSQNTTASDDDTEDDDSDDEPKQTSKGKKVKKKDDESFFKKNKIPIIVGGVALTAIAAALLLKKSNTQN